MKRRPAKQWSKEEDLFLTKYYRKMKIDDLCTKLNASRSQVRKRAKKLDLTYEMKPRSKEEDEKIIELYKSGKPVKEIGSLFNIGEDAVYQILSKNNIKTTRQPYKNRNKIFKCKVCGKFQTECNRFYKEQMLCGRHYNQLMRYGKFLDNENKDTKSCNKWTKEEIKILRQYNGCDRTCFKELSKKVNHSISSVENKFYKIGCTTNNNKWNQEDVKILQEKYSTTDTLELADILNRSQVSIICKANDIGLFKTEDYKQNIRAKCNIFIQFEFGYKMFTEDKKYYAIIDKEDYENVKQYYWFMDSVGYFRTSYINENKVRGKHFALHRYIMNEKDNSVIIDHINQKRYDNRRCNLRRVTAIENLKNHGFVDGILRIQDNLFRCYSNRKLLFEGTYSECKKILIMKDGVDINTICEQIMYQIPGLFELLSDEDKKKCLEDLQKKYKNKLEI